MINTRVTMAKWTGIQTVAMTKLYITGGIKDTKLAKTIRKIRDVLQLGRDSMWKKRRDQVYGDEGELAFVEKLNDIKPQRKRTQRKQSLLEFEIISTTTVRIVKAQQEVETPQDTSIDAVLQQPRATRKGTNNTKMWTQQTLPAKYTIENTVITVQGKKEKKKKYTQPKIDKAAPDKTKTRTKRKQIIIKLEPHEKRWRVWNDAHNRECYVCKQNGLEIKTKCEGCMNSFHEQCKTKEMTNLCSQCIIRNTPQHALAKEQGRQELQRRNEETHSTWSAQHDTQCHVCTQDKYENKRKGQKERKKVPLLPCASCMRSVHEKECMNTEEEEKGWYWQCSTCREAQKEIHTTYTEEQRLQQRKYHGTTRVLWGMKELHDIIKKRRTKEQGQTEKDKHTSITPTGTSSGVTKQGERTTIQVESESEEEQGWKKHERGTTPEYSRVPMTRMVKTAIELALPGGREVMVHGDGHCCMRAVSKVLGMQPGQLMSWLAIEAAEQTRTGNRLSVNHYSTEKIKHREKIYTQYAQLTEERAKQDLPRNEWSGSDELKLVAIVTQRPVIVVTPATNSFTTYTTQRKPTLVPSANARGGTHRMVEPANHVVEGKRNIRELQNMYMEMKHDKPIVLMYHNQVHYNAWLMGPDNTSMTTIPRTYREMRRAHNKEVQETNAQAQTQTKKQKKSRKMTLDDSDEEEEDDILQMQQHGEKQQEKNNEKKRNKQHNDNKTRNKKKKLENTEKRGTGNGDHTKENTQRDAKRKKTEERKK